MKILFALFSLSFALSAWGQMATNDWLTFDAGGGANTSANYTIGATFGQPDAYLASSASYSFVGGFWALSSLTPGQPPPMLFIAHNPPNVLVWWPSPSTGYVLQQNLDLSNPQGWSDVGSVVSDNGVTRSVTLPTSLSPRFLRLRKP